MLVRPEFDMQICFEDGEDIVANRDIPRGGFSMMSIRDWP